MRATSIMAAVAKYLAPVAPTASTSLYQFHLAVHVKPGARRGSSFAAVPQRDVDDCVECCVAAPPVDGRANEELAEFLAEALQRQVRALQSAVCAQTSPLERETALRVFFEDTSFASILEKGNVGTTNAVEKKIQTAANGGEKRSHQKKKEALSSSAAAHSSQAVGPSTNKTATLTSLTTLPLFRNEKSNNNNNNNNSSSSTVSVSLVKGQTSRSKTVLLEVPVPAEVLVPLIEKMAKEGL